MSDMTRMIGATRHPNCDAGRHCDCHRTDRSRAATRSMKRRENRDWRRSLTGTY